MLENGGGALVACRIMSVVALNVLRLHGFGLKMIARKMGEGEG